MRNKLLCGFLAVVLCMVASNIFFGLIVPKLAWSRALSVAVGSLLGLILGAVISNSITKNIGKLAKVTSSIGEGDLTQEIPIQSDDEVGYLADAFRRMVSNLRQMISQLGKTSGSILESSQEQTNLVKGVNLTTEEIAATMEHISRGAEKQSILAEKGSAIMKDMSDSIEDVALKAEVTAASTSQVGEIAKRESKLMQSAMKNLEVIFSQIESSGEVIKNFTKKIRQVARFLDMITAVSHQANTLSFNATIEATRAGEFGRGFSVVAEEMRRLAERTKEFTVEVTEITEEIERDGLLVLSSIEEETGRIDEGKKSIETTIEALGEMVKNITDAVKGVQMISEITQRQRIDSEKVVKTMSEVARLAEENAGATEEVAVSTEELVSSMEKVNSSAQDLSSISRQLKEAIAGFKLEGDAEQIRI